MLWGFRPGTAGEPHAPGTDGAEDLETGPQPEDQCWPSDYVAMLSLCTCSLTGAVAILTYFMVAAGSEIVAAREGVMSTSPLSDTFPGNLAGAARL